MKRRKRRKKKGKQTEEGDWNVERRRVSDKRWTDVLQRETFNIYILNTFTTGIFIYTSIWTSTGGTNVRPFEKPATAIIYYFINVNAVF